MKKILFILLQLFILNIHCTELDPVVRPLKILFIIEKFPWHTKAIMLNQVISLLDRGHDVYIYTYRGLGKDEVDLEILEYGIYDRIYYNQFPDNLQEFDFVISQYGFLGKEYIYLKNLCSQKTKFITFFRGGDITTDKHMQYDGYKKLLEESDMLFPICYYFKYKLIMLGCDPKKIEVIYSPINCDRFCIANLETNKKKKFNNIDPIRLISVNRLEEEKAVSVVIEAVESLVKQYPNLQYTVVGDGVLRSKLEEKIKKKNLEDVVILVGWKTQAEVKELLLQSDIFILASITPPRGNQEAIPNAIKEAMLLGIPVISTYHGGIPELLVDGITGFIVPEKSSNAIVAKVISILENEHNLDTIIQNAAVKTKKMFDMNIVNKKLISVLEKMAK